MRHTFSSFGRMIAFLPLSGFVRRLWNRQAFL